MQWVSRVSVVNYMQRDGEVFDSGEQMERFPQLALI